MRFFPKTAADWTRSFAYPLFAVCVILLLASTVASFGSVRVWKYAGESIGIVLLPLLGAALGLTCCFGTGLDTLFKRWALVVAALSVLYPPLLAPALA